MSDRIRLLVCGECKTIEELPWYEGPVEGDTLLEVLASRHEYPSGQRHGGANLFDVEEKHWRDPYIQKRIVEEITVRTGKGLGDEFYNIKNTFQEDAFTCWKRHNRTRNCDDYKSDRKRLMPNTRQERKEAGLPPFRSNRFLCEFCPVQSVYMQRMRAKRGDYHYVD